MEHRPSASRQILCARLPCAMRFADLIDAFAPASGPPPARLAPFIGWCLRGAWRIIALAGLASAAIGIVEVLAFWFVGWVIDFALAQGTEGGLRALMPAILGGAFFFILLRPLLTWLVSSLQSIAVVNNIFPLIMSRLHRHTIGQALSFFDDDFAGRIAQKQQQTARALADVVAETLQAGVFAVAAVLGAMLLVGGISPVLGGLVVVWVLALVALMRWFIPRIRERAAARADARARVTGQLVDTITNIRTVKLFAHGAFEDQAALGALSHFRDKGLAFSQLTVWMRVSVLLIAGLLPVVMISGALILWQQGAASPGDIAAAAMVATRLAQMSGWVSFTALGIFSNIGEIEDGIQTLAHPHRIEDRAKVTPLTRAAGAVAFEHVSFGYGRGMGALENFTLRLAPGEKIGLVGRSGAGKTTAVSLLMRLYDTEDGQITLDGTDIRALAQDDLRRQIAMVTQDAETFNRSAFDNIRYGRPEAEAAEVFAAAAQAEAARFIPDLRDFRGRTGYDAHLGERGVKLSGGQRQRIALARAILKDAPVLVLDEATSALDSEVEAEIQASLARAMEGKTVIAIAHRLSTIAQMDRIVVMDAGRIVEMGPHETLIAQGGLYAELWSRQSGGFLGDDGTA